MEVVCKPSKNAIFWKESEVDWNWADLDEVISTYENSPIGKGTTNLRYGYPARKEKTREILYHVFFCEECESAILLNDTFTHYNYCPYCGRPIKD